ncbi:MAG: hypothetical protein P8Y92_16310 [Halioglobus sp.]
MTDHSGCRQRFSCPYHAWTWSNAGKTRELKIDGPALELGNSAVACRSSGVLPLGFQDSRGELHFLEQ